MVTGDTVNEVKMVIKLEEQLASYAGEDAVITSHDAMKYQDGLKSPVIFRTDYPRLDDIIDGFEPGELVIISGPTGNGKTTFAQSLTMSFNFKETRSLWFSFEVHPKQFLNKFPHLPTFYMPKVNTETGVDWIEKRIMEAKLKYDVNAVFIDHLHYVVDFHQAMRNMSLVYGETMRKLKQLALKHNVVIFLLAHTTKLRSDENPDIGDIRDSSFIVQESDIVLMIWRRVLMAPAGDINQFTNEAKLGIFKNRRNGRLGIIKLEHKDGIFYEVNEQ